MFHSAFPLPYFRDMGWISFKSMLIVLGRPALAHQAVVKLKLKEIKILISDIPSNFYNNNNTNSFCFLREKKNMKLFENEILNLEFFLISLKHIKILLVH